MRNRRASNDDIELQDLSDAKDVEIAALLPPSDNDQKVEENDENSAVVTKIVPVRERHRKLL